MSKFKFFATSVLAIAAFTAHSEPLNTQNSQTVATAVRLNDLAKTDPSQYLQKWNEPIHVNGHWFYPLAHLNLDQIQYYQQKMLSKTESIKNYTIKVTLPYPTPLKIIKNNEDRMASGISPIGDDNNPIQICSITKTNTDTYVEMTNTQWKAIAKALNINSDKKNDYCLSDRITTNYWPFRLAYSVDSQNNIVKSNN